MKRGRVQFSSITGPVPVSASQRSANVRCRTFLAIACLRILNEHPKPVDVDPLWPFRWFSRARRRDVIRREDDGLSLLPPLHQFFQERMANRVVRYKPAGAFEALDRFQQTFIRQQAEAAHGKKLRKLFFRRQ